MRRVGFLGCLVVALSATAVMGVPYLSFEEAPAVGGQYTDTLDPMTDHALVDNAGEPWVNYPATGGELGFAAYYYNTRDDAGLSDGDYFGVTDYAGAVGEYPHGDQGYQMSDCDGKVVLSVETVDLTGLASPSVYMEYFVQETGWEAEDMVKIWLTLDGSTDMVLLDTTGSDIDDLAIEDAWIGLSADLAGYSSAQLHMALDSNSSSEALFVDNIIFPEPGSLALLMIGGLALVQRRR